MDLKNLIHDFTSLFIGYLDELREYFNIESPENFRIFELKQFDNTCLLTIELESSNPLISILHRDKRNFERQLLRLFYSLRTYYNFKAVEITFDNEYIELQFELYPYPSTLLILPDEVIRKTFLSSNIKDIENLCLTDEKIKEKVCDSNTFWYEKLIHDLGNKFRYTTKAKEMYYNHGKLWAFKPIFNQSTLISNDVKFKLISMKFNKSLFIDYDNNLWCLSKTYLEENRGLKTHSKLKQYSKLSYKLKDIVIYPKLKEIGQKYDNVDSIIYPSIIAIDSSESHSIILDENGLIWKFTAGADKDYKTLISRRFLTKSISCSRYYTLIIDVDGNLWGFAYPEFSINIFGHRIEITRHLTKIELPFRVKNVSGDSYRIILIDKNDELWLCDIINGQNLIDLGIKAKHVVCNGHCMIIDENDDLWAFGRNYYGQLGLGHFIDVDQPIRINLNFKVKNVVCGEEFTILLDQDDNLWGCGRHEGILPETYNIFSRIYLDHKVDLIAAEKEKVAWTALY